MGTEQQLHERSGSMCELCNGKDDLKVYEVAPPPAKVDGHLLACGKCLTQINDTTLDANHWRCLNNTMWSEVPAVQVMAWRLLNRLQRQGEGWAQDLLDTLYLDDEMLAWAKAGAPDEERAEDKIIHKDSNGTVLQAGDTVVLIKDLDVKGGGFTAKRGTTVKGIALVENNSAQIEGRVSGQQIVILTQYVKKVM
jgi:protein PhnA